MIVDVVMTNEEVHLAIREWLASRGVPVLAIERMRVQGKNDRHVWDNLTDVRVQVAFVVDSYSSKEAEPVEPMSDGRRLAR